MDRTKPRLAGSSGKMLIETLVMKRFIHFKINRRVEVGPHTCNTSHPSLPRYSFFFGTGSSLDEAILPSLPSKTR